MAPFTKIMTGATATVCGFPLGYISIHRLLYYFLRQKSITKYKPHQDELKHTRPFYFLERPANKSQALK